MDSIKRHQHRPKTSTFRAFVMLTCLWSCGGDDLPEIADVGIRDSLVAFDSNVGRGRCMRTAETCNRRDDDCDGQIDEAEDVRVQVIF